jgi:MFS family permease
MFKKIQSTMSEYPRNFWVLIGALFIDRVGGALIFPFLSLYITSKFNVGLTQVGAIFVVHSISSFGPLAAGIIIDNYNPNWVWYASGIICSMVALGYYVLKTRVGERFQTPTVKKTVPAAAE